VKRLSFARSALLMLLVNCYPKPVCNPCAQVKHRLSSLSRLAAANAGAVDLALADDDAMFVDSMEGELQPRHSRPICICYFATCGGGGKGGGGGVACAADVFSSRRLIVSAAKAINNITQPRAPLSSSSVLSFAFSVCP
jgi:hypothetical protein